MTDWIKACSTDNLGQGEMFSFDHNEKKLLLTNMNGKILILMEKNILEKLTL